MKNMTIAGTTTLLLLMMAALGGCANKHLTFEKSGATAADLQRDQNECLVTGIDSAETAKVLIPHVDRDAVIRCMEARGYRVSSR